MGKGLRWVSIALVVALVSVASPVLGDRLIVHERDENATLVADPTGSEDFRIEQTGPANLTPIGNYIEYEFQIEAPDNRLELDLVYDPGPVAIQGRCLYTTDLDLYIEGPEDWQRAYPGCDGGSITVFGSAIPVGNYTVRVEAEEGTTMCLPSPGDLSCTAPDVDYLFEVKAWDLDD